MKKIPYGIINYESLITEGYEYIDKTMYLEKLENVEKTLFYLRPGRFGKSLFTSMMFYYYDINSESKFNTLFKDTYVYKNPTPNKNNYYVLKFDFSNITTSNQKNDQEEARIEFTNKVKAGIENFEIDYNVKANIDYSKSPNAILLDFFIFFKSLNKQHKLYILIDEYDNFTNAILEGDAKDFLGVVGNAGFVKGFYAVIKEYIGLGVVDRFFATGICPITLNSMTTGFNIATDISTNPRFNSMVGLTHEEVKNLLSEYDKETQETIFNIMIKNYDGYLFSDELLDDERVFNATLVMYLLSKYEEFKKIPAVIYDNNITVNYGKIDNLLKLQNNRYYKEIIDALLSSDEIESTLTTQFNLLEDFTKANIISLLYYFGYLTINGKALLGETNFKIPNEAMKQTYGNYFIKLLSDVDVIFDNEIVKDALREMMSTGNVEKITNYISELLHKIDSQFFLHFRESNIEQFYYLLLLNSREFKTQIEYPCIGGGHVDVFLESITPLAKYSIMIELKYLPESKNSNEEVNKSLEEAKEQLRSRKVNQENIKRYAIVFVGRDINKLEEVIC